MRDINGVQRKEYVYKVYTTTTIKLSDYFFELSVVELNNEMRLSMVNRHEREEFKAKGIPEALVPIIKATFHKVVTSSTEKDKYKLLNTERREKTVDKIFVRLDAEYDREQDLFTY